MSDTEKKEMFLTAKTKRDSLEESLSVKLQRLKDLCIEEAVSKICFSIIPNHSEHSAIQQHREQ